MPTRRGWAALGAAVALGAAWVAVGERLLLAGGVFFLLVLGTGIVYTRRIAPTVRISRSIVPAQVHEGDRAVVELRVGAARRLRHALVEDRVHGLGSARFLAAHLGPDEPVVGRYEVLAHPRGVHRIGPATVTVEDAVGLAATTASGGRVDRLVVFPAVEDLLRFPVGRGQDPGAHATHATHAPHGGEDFFTLREYHVGDDLRRVHWPSSARSGDLMIRQLEVQWRSRALVVLDTRRSAYPDAAAFEHAVRGAASVLRHLFRGGFSPTLWAGRGRGVGVTSPESYLMAMEELAVVAPSVDLDLRAAGAGLRRRGVNGHVLVLVTGRLDDADLVMFHVLSRDFRRPVVLTASDEVDPSLQAVARAGAAIVQAGPGSRWATAWELTMEATWSTAGPG